MIIIGCVRAKVTDHDAHAQASTRHHPSDVSPAAPVAAGPLEDGLYCVYKRRLCDRHAAYVAAGRPGKFSAQTVVGLMYYFNYGDDVRRTHWFNLAAAQGNAFAEMFVKDTADKMTPAQIAEAQKLAREWNSNTQSHSR